MMTPNCRATCSAVVMVLALVTGGCATLRSRPHHEDKQIYGYRQDPYFDEARHARFPLHAALVVSETVRKEEPRIQPCSMAIDVPVGKIATRDALGMLQNWFEHATVVMRVEDAADADFVLELGRPNVSFVLGKEAGCDSKAIFSKTVAGVFTLGLGFFLGPDARLSASVSQPYRVLRTPDFEPWEKLVGNHSAAGRGESDGFGVYTGSSISAAQQAFDKAMREMLRQMAAPFRKEARELMASAADYKSGAVRIVAHTAGDAVIEQVPAFDGKPRDQDFAIVIGVERYLNSVPHAEFAAADARLVQRYLIAMGYRPENVEILMNERATQAGVRRAIESWLPNRVRADSRVFVYYAGHGAAETVSGEAFLVPYDGDPGYLADTGYPLKRLYERLGTLKVASAAVVLDACFSGGGGRSVLAPGTRPLVLVNDRAPVAPHVAVLTSASGNQIAASSRQRRHGVFTFHFLRALQAGKKELGEIYDYVLPAVESEARLMNVVQVPSLLPTVDTVRGRFHLRP